MRCNVLIIFFSVCQACDDPLDRKRAVYLLRSLGAAEAAPSLGTLLQLYETLDEFSLHTVEVTAHNAFRLDASLTFLTTAALQAV
jgi:hypothetical protein